MKNSCNVLPSQLAGWLKEAKDEHTKMEATAAGPDLHWESWYGSFLAYRMTGYGQHQSASWATQDMLAKPAVR